MVNNDVVGDNLVSYGFTFIDLLLLTAIFDDTQGVSTFPNKVLGLVDRLTNISYGGIAMCVPRWPDKCRMKWGKEGKHNAL